MSRRDYLEERQKDEERSRQNSRREKVATWLCEQVMNHNWGTASSDRRECCLQGAEFVIGLADSEVTAPVEECAVKLNEILRCDKIIGSHDAVHWQRILSDAVGVAIRLRDTPNTTKIREERREVYGDAQICHTAIGEAFRGILRQRWQMVDVPEIDAHTVALMLAAFKCIRAATKSGHADSYLDAKSYIELAEQFLDEAPLR